MYKLLDEKHNNSLKIFEEELLKWNKTYNLIAKSTIDDAWQRHIVDSLPIIPYIEQAYREIFATIKQDKCNIFDFGSGGGLPVIPMAIIFADKLPDMRFFAFESVAKKANFLKNCKRRIGLENLQVINNRIESILPQSLSNVAEEEVKADIITCRAFAELLDIFDISQHLIKPETQFILHKGKSIEEEITKAEQKYSFDYNLNKIENSDGCILSVRNIVKN